MEELKGHPNVVGIEDTFADDAHVYIVMPLMRGGELLERIRSRLRFSEADACALFEKLTSALEHMHSKDIVHRDLKPENILFEHEGEDAEVRICDFGFARKCKSGDAMMTPCGTDGYAPPEILFAQKNVVHAGYDKSCDMWSLGVILYTMLCGYPPFSVSGNRPVAELQQKIEDAAFEFPEEQWRDVSVEARDLIGALLTVDPKRRIDARGALKHAWVTTFGTGLKPSQGPARRQGSDLLSPAMMASPSIFERSRSNLAETLSAVQAPVRAGEIERLAFLAPIDNSKILKRRRTSSAASISSVTSARETSSAEPVDRSSVFTIAETAPDEASPSGKRSRGPDHQ